MSARPLGYVEVVMTPYPDPCLLTGRRRTTVAQWYNRPPILANAVAYWFDPFVRASSEQWQQIEGIDDRGHGVSFDVLFFPERYRGAVASQPIYITAADYEVLTTCKS